MIGVSTPAADEIGTDPAIDAVLRAGAPCVISCSGGKDSQAAAIATARYLDAIGHQGARVVIHADLGMVEWSQSLSHSERIAQLIGAEFVVVRRKAGGLMERWESRWASSVRRYANLETVTLVLPWSTPGMRFCTSELKTHVINAELKRRYGSQSVINVTGIRREESAARARSTLLEVTKNPRLGTVHIDWRPILDWKLVDVRRIIDASGLPWHHAYTLGMSRVSCVICIMSNTSDIRIASTQPENAEIVRRIIQLECASTFGFQGARWLAEIAAPLLTESERDAVRKAKAAAAVRQSAEARIPRDLLYTKGWPTRMPTRVEAHLLAEVRRSVVQAVQLEARFLDAESILDRYQELIRIKEAKALANVA